MIRSSTAGAIWRRASPVAICRMMPMRLLGTLLLLAGLAPLPARHPAEAQPQASSADGAFICLTIACDRGRAFALRSVGGQAAAAAGVGAFRSGAEHG